MITTRLTKTPLVEGAVKILLIEDNRGDAVLIETALEPSEDPPFTVHVESRLVPALERLNSEKFDIVLLDLNLPDSFGFETVTSVQEVVPRTPVVIVTGNMDEAFARTAVQSGVQDYLVKDEIRPYSLIRTILFAMERKRIENNLYALEEVASAAVATLDLDAILEAVLGTLRSVMGADRTALLMAEDGDLSIKAQSAGGLSRREESSEDKKLSRQVLVEGRPAFARIPEEDGGEFYVLKVPLTIEGEAGGVLEVEWAAPHAESEREVALLTVAAERIASGMSNARAYESVKRSERSANEERSRLRTIIDTLPVGILITDRNGRQMESNALRAKIWGGTPKPSTSMDDLCAIHAWYADSGEAVKECPVVKALKYGEVDLGETINIERLDGSYGTILASAAPIRDESGTLLGAVGVQQDITDRIRLEQRLVTAMERSEFYIDLLTHDVANSLASASGYLQLIEPSGMGGEKTTQWLMRALTSLDDSARLIDTVRRVHNLGSSPKTKIDLDVMLPEVIAHVLPRGDGAEIIYSGMHDAMVTGTGLLPDLFTNLLENAVKHSKGRVSIAVTVRPHYFQGIDYVRVDISDNGPGIPDQLKERLFVRGERGITRAPGHGMGLFLVSNIVAEVGGRIWAEDRVPGDPAKGARFVVLLPRSKDE
ncbi:MAG: ATP-binding protein [Methanomassiliicoccus sp.]|nr:ATP-binding protein [Methanomassiliicoccus sp.]